jgi:hypothetical protein
MLMLGLLIYLELFDEFFNNMFDPIPLEKLTDLLISGLHPRMPPTADVWKALIIFVCNAEFAPTQIFFVYLINPSDNEYPLSLRMTTASSYSNF